eukprot:7061916-Prymnesium_polylepis.1
MEIEEDKLAVLQLSGTNSMGLCMLAVLTSLPRNGKLYTLETGYEAQSHFDAGNEISTIGELRHPSTGNYLLYQPNPDEEGIPFDSFTFSYVYAEYASLVSASSTFTIDVVGVDDVPTAFPGSYSISEDAPNGLIVHLNATDSEVGQLLEIFIAELPTKGKLYILGGQPVAGSDERLITRPYNSFDVGSVYGQYLHNITAISSFYTWPPSLEYTPLTLPGPPGCDSYGDKCTQQAPVWETDFSIAPPIGTRLFVHPWNESWLDTSKGQDGWARSYWPKIPAHLRQVHGDGTVTVEYLPMYKFDEDGIARASSSYGTSASYSYSYDGQYNYVNSSNPEMELRRCRMWPNPTGRMFYPQECHFDPSL